MLKKVLFSTLLALVINGCAIQKPHQQTSPFTEAGVRSLLIVPIVNHSLDVDAPNYMLSTLSIPLAERGYYVFPVNTVKTVLEQEGFYEAAVIHQQNSAALAGLFGADAVMYVTINRWDAQYAVLTTTVTVDFSYRVVTSDGVEIWSAEKKMQYTPQNNNSSGNPMADLLASAIQAAITKAKPNYLPLAEQANNAVTKQIPKGPYALQKTAQE